ncbi:acyl carrier protein [Salinimicrobium profundisediminis]|uniref:acyl carrier protein n=1 Tax=Salinimicrobium profundisediminis TaxID=2994553 RepID=UPI003520E58E
MKFKFYIQILFLAVLISISCSKEEIQTEKLKNSAGAVTVEKEFLTIQNFSPIAVELKVTEIIESVLNPSIQLTSQTSLSEDLGADEYDLNLIQMNVEGYFGIIIPDPQKLTTVGAWIEFVKIKVTTIKVYSSNTSAVEVLNTEFPIDYFCEIIKRSNTQEITEVNNFYASAPPVITQTNHSETNDIITKEIAYTFVSGSWDKNGPYPRITWKGVIITKIQDQTGSIETKKYHTHIAEMGPLYPKSVVNILTDTPHSEEPDSSVEPTIFERINEVLINELNIHPEQITPDANFTYDFHLDEFDIILLITGIESEFEIEISDESAETIFTVNDLYELVQDLTNFPIETGQDDIFYTIKMIIVDKFEIDPEQVAMQSSIIDDLGGDILDTIELVMDIEDEFNIAIPDHEAQAIVTVQDMYDLVIKYFEY